jgi:hypothetical protein
MRVRATWLHLCLRSALALVLTGCSLDWTVVAKDAAADLDGGPRVDASLPVEAGADGARVDAQVAGEPPRDAGQRDASKAPDDAGNFQPDAGVVVAPDAGVVVPPDAGVPADPARVLLLHLDEPTFSTAAGAVRDESGLGNHGTVRGTLPSSIAGRFGGAAALAGTDWIEVADAPSLRPSSALTVSVWFYLDTLPDMRWVGLVNKRSAFNVDTTFALFIAADARITVDVDGEESRFTSKVLATTSRWTHVAFVFDGSLPMDERVKLYIDGVLDTTAAEPSAILPPYAASVVVGNLVNGGDTFVGRLDEVALWTRALSGTEITALQQAASR